MNYMELIEEAFWIAWRNRFLWVFALLMSALGLISSVPSNLLNINNLAGDPAGINSPGNVERFLSDNAGLIVTLAVVFVVLLLVNFLVSLVSIGALIDSVAALHRGEERNFSLALRAGLSNFWRVLGFSALLVLFSVGLGLLAAVATFFLVSGLLAIDSSSARIAFFILAYLLLFVVILLVSIPLGIIFVFGLQALVVDREGVFASVRIGYRLLVRRLGKTLLILLIGGALSLGASLVLLATAAILGLLFAVPALILFAIDLSTAGVVAGVIAGTGLLIFYLVAAAAVTAFNYAYWTLAYLQLTALEGETSSER